MVRPRLRLHPYFPCSSWARIVCLRCRLKYNSSLSCQIARPASCALKLHNARRRRSSPRSGPGGHMSTESPCAPPAAHTLNWVHLRFHSDMLPLKKTRFRAHVGVVCLTSPRSTCAAPLLPSSRPQGRTARTLAPKSIAAAGASPACRTSRERFSRSCSPSLRPGGAAQAGCSLVVVGPGRTTARTAPSRRFGSGDPGGARGPPRRRRKASRCLPSSPLATRSYSSHWHHHHPSSPPPPPGLLSHRRRAGRRRRGPLFRPSGNSRLAVKTTPPGPRRAGSYSTPHRTAPGGCPRSS